MSGPFSGFGIHSDLQVESFSTAKDPYYKQIKEILSSNNIMETLSIDYSGIDGNTSNTKKKSIILIRKLIRTKFML